MKMTVENFKALSKYAMNEIREPNTDDGKLVGFVFFSDTPVPDADKFLFDGVWRTHGLYTFSNILLYYYRVYAPGGMTEEDIIKILEE